MHKKLGIIAGGGAIPQDLINFCKENKRDYFVIAIEGNADKALIDDSIPHAWISPLWRFLHLIGIWCRICERRLFLPRSE